MRAFVPTLLRRAAQRGAIAILALITLPILFGFGALVVDLARLFVYKTEVQNAMDACALAAASPLTGTTDPKIFDIAIAHGKATMDISKTNATVARTANTVNRLHFQKDDFSLGDVQVEFSTALSGAAWLASTTADNKGLLPKDAKYVRCTYEDNDNPLFFKPLLSVFLGPVGSTAAVAADAVGTLGHAQGTCVFPIAICIDPTKIATDTPPWGLTPGTRKTAIKSGQQYGTGNFGWIMFTTPANATALAALITGNGTCTVALGSPGNALGVVNTLQNAWNTRFGLYANSYGATNRPAPDFTAYSYAGIASPNYTDYVTRLTARAPFNGTVASNYQLPLTSAQHGALGKKRRLTTAAMVDCSIWNTPPGNQASNVKDFGCILLSAPVKSGGGWTAATNDPEYEYLGLANAVGSPCASSGLAGGVYGPLVPVLAK